MRPRTAWIPVALATLLAAGTPFAAEPGKTADLDAQLQAARAKLEQAAHEVAELSAKLSEPVMDQFTVLRDGRARALIGAQLEPVQDGKGARIREVSPGGAAAEAGLQAGDVIAAIDGTVVRPDETTQAIAHRLRDLTPDRKVKVRVLRAGKPQEAEIKVRAAPRREFDLRAFGVEPPVIPELPELPPMPPLPESFAGQRALRSEVGDMELVSVTPKLGQYFGTDKGVLVVRAPKSAIFKLEEGDVIRSIDGREPETGAQVLRILRSYEPGEKIRIKLLRQRKELDLDVTLPKPAADRTLRERRLRLRDDDDLPT